MEILDVAAGVTIVAEGDRAGDFYYLLDGEARVEVGGETVRRLVAGDFFGEVALVTRSRRTATVTTTAPSKLLAIDESGFRRLLERDAIFSARVWEAAEARL
jgi:voltage-gated potassium channel